MQLVVAAALLLLAAAARRDLPLVDVLLLGNLPASATVCLLVSIPLAVCQIQHESLESHGDFPSNMVRLGYLHIFCPIHGAPLVATTRVSNRVDSYPPRHPPSVFLPHPVTVYRITGQRDGVPASEVTATDRLCLLLEIEAIHTQARAATRDALSEFTRKPKDTIAAARQVADAFRTPMVARDRLYAIRDHVVLVWR